VAGEVGEAANPVKKVVRSSAYGDIKPENPRHVIEEELAYIFISS
jgi:hypothetical protein